MTANIQGVDAAARAAAPLAGISGPLAPGSANGVAAADGSLWEIDFDPSATDAQKSAAIMAVAAFDPSKPPAPDVDFLGFEALFTPTEQAGLYAAVLKSPQLAQWFFRAAGANGIALSNPETIAGVNLLASIGLIDQSRVAIILAGTPAPQS